MVGPSAPGACREAPNATVVGPSGCGPTSASYDAVHFHTARLMVAITSLNQAWSGDKTLLTSDDQAYSNPTHFLPRLRSACLLEWVGRCRTSTMPEDTAAICITPTDRATCHIATVVIRELNGWFDRDPHARACATALLVQRASAAPVDVSPSASTTSSVTPPLARRWNMVGDRWAEDLHPPFCPALIGTLLMTTGCETHLAHWILQVGKSRVSISDDSWCLIDALMLDTWALCHWLRLVAALVSASVTTDWFHLVWGVDGELAWIRVALQKAIAGMKARTFIEITETNTPDDMSLSTEPRRCPPSCFRRTSSLVHQA